MAKAVKTIKTIDEAVQAYGGLLSFCTAFGISTYEFATQ
jgi:hypothetical protein